jgi:hypothetical protein
LIAVVAAFVTGNALALSPAPPPIPGIELIRRGDCVTFARTITDRDAYSIYGWFDALVSLDPGQWLACLDALPRHPATAHRLLAAVADNADDTLLVSAARHLRERDVMQGVLDLRPR